MPDISSGDNQIKRSRLFCFALLAIIIASLILTNAHAFRPEALPSHDTLCTLSGFAIFCKHLQQYGDIPLWRPYSTFGGPMDWNHLLLLAPSTCLFSLLGAGGICGDLVLLFKIALIVEQFVFAGACCWLACMMYKNHLAIILFVASSILTSSCWMQVYFNFRWVSGLPWILIFLLLAFRKKSRAHLILSLIFVITSVYGCSYYSVVPYGFFWLCTFFTLYFSPDSGNPRHGWIFGKFSRKEAAAIIPSAAGLLIVTALIAAQLLLVKAGQTPISQGRDPETGLMNLKTFLSYGKTFTFGQLFSAAIYGSRSGRPFELTLFLGIPMIALAFVGLFGKGLPNRIFKNQSALFASFCISGLTALILFYVPGVSNFRHVGYTAVFLRFSLCALAGFGLQQILDSSLSDRTKGQCIDPVKLVIGALIAAILLFSFAESKIFPESFGQAFAIYDLRVSIGGAAVFLLILLLLKFKVQMPWAGPALLTFLPLIVISLVNAKVFEYTSLSEPKLKPLRTAFSNPIVPVMERPGDPHGLSESLIFLRGMWGSVYDTMDSCINIDSPPTRRYDLLPSDTAMALNLFVQNRAHFDKITLAGMPKIFLAVPALPSDGKGRPIPLQNPEPLASNVLVRQATASGYPSLEEFSFNRVSFRIPAADAEGEKTDRYLVYADGYHPEWIAEVNGEPTPVWKASALFKAVKLDDGAASVTFSFGTAYRHAVAWANYVLAMLFFLGQAGFLLVACFNRAVRSGLGDGAFT